MAAALQRARFRRTATIALTATGMLTVLGCTTLLKSAFYAFKSKDEGSSAKTGPQEDGNPQPPSEPIVADCDLADLPDRKPHPSVAVLDFHVSGSTSGDAGMSFADVCRETIHDSDRYVLVDRETMTALLTEEDFAATFDCDDTRCLVDYGKKLRAQKIIHGRVGRVGGSCLITVKIVDVGSAAVDAVKTRKVSGPQERVLDFIRPTTCELLHEALASD